METSIKQHMILDGYKREMLTEAIVRYLKETSAKDWTEAQQALWNEMKSVNKTTPEEFFLEPPHY